MDLSLCPPPSHTHTHATPTPHIRSMPSISLAWRHSANLAISLISQLKTPGTEALGDFQIGGFFFQYISIVVMKDFLTLGLFVT